MEERAPRAVHHVNRAGNQISAADDPRTQEMSAPGAAVPGSVVKKLRMPFKTSHLNPLDPVNQSLSRSSWKTKSGLI